MNIYKQIFELHADLLKALSHPKRLEVVQLLRDQQMCVSQIQEMLGLNQANLSQHLQILREAGVLKTQRDGQKIIYTLTDERIVQACDLLREHLAQKHKHTQLGDGLSGKLRELMPLVIDPVCGMRLSPKTASYAYTSQGHTHYFCAEGCFDKFISQVNKLSD